MDDKKLIRISMECGTPTFVFDVDEFKNQADKIKRAIGDIPLCFSIKANPFLLGYLPESISYVEVCSPGELAICQRMNIDPEMIIYSGVNKGIDDIKEAVNYGAGILTAESRLHLELINEAAGIFHKKVKLIIRVSNGNQFGADPDEVENFIKNRADFDNVDIIGLHYYTGTQKKKSDVIAKDIADFDKFIERLNENCDYVPEHIEYGPGMAADYFVAPYDETDDKTLDETAVLLKQFASKYNLTVEMGRFLASSCGTYLTKVADVKTNCGTNYVICDGGINQLKYFGQTMAMQVPPITYLGESIGETKPYTLCGSLCTTADLLVRKVELPEIKIGDTLAFHRCGAYTITEGIALFLSRTMPKVVVYSEGNGARTVRDFYYTDVLNTPSAED